MATLFVRHQVADYAAWRRVYDEFAPTRNALDVDPDRLGEESLGRLAREREEEAAPESFESQLIERMRRSIHLPRPRGRPCAGSRVTIRRRARATKCRMGRTITAGRDLGHIRDPQ